MEVLAKRIDEELMLFENIKKDNAENKKDVKFTKQDSNRIFTLSIPYDDLTLEQGCFEPFLYTITIPGKNFRQDLVDMLNYWFKVPEEIIGLLKDILHILHTVSIMVDDVQDKSLLRRGIPCAYHIFGIIPVVNATSITVISSLIKAQRLPHPLAVPVYCESICQLLRGQNMETYWRDHSVCPTIDEYKIMCCRKTGSMLLLGANILQLFTKEDYDLDKLMTMFGLFFQINDDYQNLTSTFFYESKGFCEDITEGKFGYPIVHACSVNPEIGKELVDILLQRTTDIELKKHCLSLIEKCGSFEHTKKLLRQLRAAIYEEVEKIGYNPYFEGLLEKLVKSSLI